MLPLQYPLQSGKTASLRPANVSAFLLHKDPASDTEADIQAPCKQVQDSEAPDMPVLDYPLAAGKQAVPEQEILHHNPLNRFRKVNYHTLDQNNPFYQTVQNQNHQDLLKQLHYYHRRLLLQAKLLRQK